MPEIPRFRHPASPEVPCSSLIWDYFWMTTFYCFIGLPVFLGFLILMFVKWVLRLLTHRTTYLENALSCPVLCNQLGDTRPHESINCFDGQDSNSNFLSLGAAPWEAENRQYWKTHERAVWISLHKRHIRECLEPLPTLRLSSVVPDVKWSQRLLVNTV